MVLVSVHGGKRREPPGPHADAATGHGAAGRLPFTFVSCQRYEGRFFPAFDQLAREKNRSDRAPRRTT